MTGPTGPADLAVVVVNYGSTHLLADNLVRTAVGVPGARIVVVDNLSTSAERAAVTALCSTQGWDCVALPDNAGYGAGVNAGAAHALQRGARALLVLNPDAVIDGPDALALLDAVRADPDLLVAPTVLRPDGTVWSAGADLYLDDGRIRSVRRRVAGARRQFWLSGACLMTSAALWRRVGGFADEYFLYWEDVDLSHRVLAGGGRLAVHPTATATHAEGGTQGEGHASAGRAKSAVYYYYNVRNRLVFAARHLPEADVRSWLAVERAVAWEILLQGGRRQLLRPVRPVRAVLRGRRDGRRAALASLRR